MIGGRRQKVWKNVSRVWFAMPCREEVGVWGGTSGVARLLHCWEVACTQSTYTLCAALSSTFNVYTANAPPHLRTPGGQLGPHSVSRGCVRPQAHLYDPSSHPTQHTLTHRHPQRSATSSSRRASSTPTATSCRRPSPSPPTSTRARPSRTARYTSVHWTSPPSSAGWGWGWAIGWLLGV